MHHRKTIISHSEGARAKLADLPKQARLLKGGASITSPVLALLRALAPVLLSGRQGRIPLSDFRGRPDIQGPSSNRLWVGDFGRTRNKTHILVGHRPNFHHYMGHKRHILVGARDQIPIIIWVTKRIYSSVPETKFSSLSRSQNAYTRRCQRLNSHHYLGHKTLLVDFQSKFRKVTLVMREPISRTAGCSINYHQIMPETLFSRMLMNIRKRF